MKKYGKHDLYEDDLWSDDEDYGSQYDEGESGDECDEDRSTAAPTTRQFSKPPPAFFLSDALKSSVILSGEKQPSKPSSTAGSSDAHRPSVNDTTPKKSSAASIVVPYVRPRGTDRLRRNGEDVFSSLNDDAIVRIAVHLPLQDISALSCASRYLDVALSADHLYCRRSTNGDSSKKGREDGIVAGVPPSLLPCLRDARDLLLPHAPSRPSGVARKYAFEAEAYRPPKQDMDVFSSTGHTRYKPRTFRLVEQISDVAARPNNLKFVDPTTLAYTSDAPEIVTRGIRRSSRPRSVVKLPGCADVRRSAFGGHSNLCATLSGAAFGGGGTVLSVTDLSSEPSVLWQKDIEGPKTVSAAFASTNSESSSLEFGGADDGRLLLNVGGRCSVVDVACTGEEVWSNKEEEGGAFNSCLFFGGGAGGSSPLVVGMKGGSVRVYDVRRRGSAGCVSRASLPSIFSNASCRTTALDGRLFAASHGNLFCGTPVTTTTDGAKRGGGDTNMTPYTFQMDKVEGAPAMTSMAVGNGKLYVCSGKKIVVIDPRMGSKLWASHDCGSSRIVDNVVVDGTKLIVRTISGSYSYRGSRDSLHIVPMDAFVQEAPLGAAVEMDFPYCDPNLNIGPLALRGNLLAAPLHWKNFDEIRILDIQHEDASHDSYSYHGLKSKFNAQQELHRRNWNKFQEERNAKKLEEEMKEEEKERTAEAERKEKIIRRKEAKKEAGRRFKAAEKASSKERAHGRRAKDGR